MDPDQNAAAPGAAGAASPSAGASDGSAPGTGTPASGGGSPAAGSATPAPATPKKGPPLSAAARAADRAATRIAAQQKGAPNTSTATDGQQAPGGTPPPGASTEPNAGAGGPASAAAKPADGEGAPGAAPASTGLTAPQDWPKERQEAFNKLPPEARATELAFHKEMHSAFTSAMTQLAEQSRTHQEAITIGEKFQTDPKATIAELAKRAGIEVFFELPTADDNPPEEVLNDPRKYAQWVADKAVRKAKAEMGAEAKQRETERTQQETAAAVAKAGETLQQEFAAAATAHTDFADHKPKVVAILQRAQGGLTTEEAYRLATYDSMVKRINEGETAKRELATAKADLERRAKGATTLPPGETQPGVRGEDKYLSRGARAHAKAAAKLAARGITR